MLAGALAGDAVLAAVETGIVAALARIAGAVVGVAAATAAAGAVIRVAGGAATGAAAGATYGAPPGAALPGGVADATCATAVPGGGVDGVVREGVNKKTPLAAAATITPVIINPFLRRRRDLMTHLGATPQTVR